MVFILIKSFILVMVFFVGPGYSIKCYHCSTKDNEAQCLNPTSYDLPLTKCDQTALENTRFFAKKIDPSYDKIFEVDTSDMAKNMDLNCLKVVTKLGNKEYTFRGCQLAEQSNLDICVKMKKADTDYLKKTQCSRCSTDGCNSAPPNIKSDFWHFLVLGVSVFMTRYFCT